MYSAELWPKPRMSTSDALHELTRQLAIHRPDRLLVSLGSQDVREGVEPIDIGATFGVLSMASRRIENLEFFGVAARRGPVTCAGNLVVQADHDFESCPPTANLVVTGGPGWVQAAKDDATLDYLRASKARITSICTGLPITGMSVWASTSRDLKPSFCAAQSCNSSTSR